MFKKAFPFGKVAIAFVIGAAAGAAVALLYAPMTGKKMQKQVKDIVEERVDDVQKTIRKVVNA